MAMIEQSEPKDTTSKKDRLDLIESTLRSLAEDAKSENARITAANGLLKLQEYRKEREAEGEMEEDRPPEWFSPEFAARALEYLKETFAEGGLVDAEAEGVAGVSAELSQEGGGR